MNSISQVVALAVILYVAYTIRLHAIETYGRVIHEFDPWFNFRSTDYLVRNGLSKFMHWFDDQVWWPIGRPVGQTIYPGMMIVSAIIHWFTNTFLFEISLNDVCVFVPAIFGAVATLFTFLLAYEVSRDWNAATIAGAVMAVLPAHMMRSVGGGYDNESVAMTTFVATFYLWTRSLRDENSWHWGILTGLMYAAAVATWGAYTFVLNMIGIHAAVLVLLGRYTHNLHLSYSFFYVIGTIGALQIPIVGWQPLQSMEQLMPMGVFFGLHAWSLIERSRGKMTEKEFRWYRLKIIGGAILGGILFLSYMMSLGHFQSLSARVRSLFIAHTRTGNPLVDSVAEHQPTSPESFFYFLHFTYHISPLGFIMLFFNRNDSKVFMILLSLFSYYFSQKMTRLVLLLSPAASVVSAVFIWNALSWSYRQVMEFLESQEVQPQNDDDKGKKSKKGAKVAAPSSPEEYLEAIPLPVRLMVAALLVAVVVIGFWSFVNHSRSMAVQLSQPQIMYTANTHTGETIIIDDFREAYWWLRDNTPEDARIVAWWDYGYQINGIGNRTSIADGNTWNFEHIALLARSLILPEDKGHEIIKYLGDYVLIWTGRLAGMYSDDLAKMPQLANIAGSVYPDIDQKGFFVDRNGRPTPDARNSLIYTMTYYGHDPTITLTNYREVHTTKYSLVRIYEVLNKGPRQPFGSYGPALKKHLAQFKE